MDANRSSDSSDEDPIRSAFGPREHWHGVFVGHESFGDEDFWLVGLVFGDRDVAARAFEGLRRAVADAPGWSARVRVTIVRTVKDEIEYFVYPANSRPPYPVFGYSHAAIDGLLPPDLPPPIETPFRIAAFENVGGDVLLIQDIPAILEYGLRFVHESELTAADLERFLLRFNAESVLAREPYSLSLPSETSGYSRLMVLQREYFAIVDEFFERIIGKPTSKVESAEKAVDLLGERLDRAWPSKDPYAWVRDKLLLFHLTFREELARLPETVGGLKLLLGGGRFTGAYATAIQRTILYADTILVPDPLLPWLEEDREDERFQLIPFVKAAYHLLRYKPLIDAELPYPALVVFPTWERTLLAPESPARGELDQFVRSVLGHHLDISLDSDDELLGFVRGREPEFLSAVEARGLFVPPEGTSGMPIRDAVTHYRRWLDHWRAGDYIEGARRASDGEVVLSGIFERLSAQFMLLRSSDALAAQPLLAVDAQWHYYTLVTKALSETLAEQGLLSPTTTALLRALESGRFQWLGGVDVPALVKLRMNEETKPFRDRLNGMISELHASRLEDLDRVSAEVARGIASLLAEHQKKIRTIEDKYRRLHGLTLAASAASLAATLIPALAPFLAVAAPLVLGLGYAKNKLDERAERREAACSLLGVLSSAANG